MKACLIRYSFDELLREKMEIIPCKGDTVIKEKIRYKVEDVIFNFDIKIIEIRLSTM